MIRRTFLLALVSIACLLSVSAQGQSQTKSLAERLGYPANAKLVIVHADDLGMAHSINEATIKAFATGLVNSGSIMIPCSWVPEITAYAKANPQADLGLHLTLTSEWRDYRWRPLLTSGNVSSLLDQNGYLHLTEQQAAANIKVAEVEIEIRAQVERARKLGIQPTHLDSHMGTLYQSKELFEALLRVARENKLPVRVSKGMHARLPFLSQLLTPEDIVLDNIVTIDQSVKSEDWAKYYMEALVNLPPGVTEFVIHLAYDDNEMKGIAVDHPNWGSAWRQRDYDFFTSAAFRKMLQDNQIKLVTWRDLRKVQYGY
jgi:predicted glycoside hydrolase/deacetylase ChbG (UPF0249 family)